MADFSIRHGICAYASWSKGIIPHKDPITYEPKSNEINRPHIGPRSEAKIQLYPSTLVVESFKNRISFWITLKIMSSKTLCGITVPDTPLITAAEELVHSNMEPWAYNHVMRSWLLGFAIAERIPDLKDRDRELHSIAAILHDLGWIVNNEAFTSQDKCFEVDGANSARSFIEKQSSLLTWDKHRQQLLWDAIALHTYPAVAFHKEPEVKAVGLGILADFVGPAGVPGGALTQAEWDAIRKDYPRNGFKTGVVDLMCGLCRNKPETTFSSFVGDFGEELVDGYTRKGKRAYDIIVNSVDAD